MNILFISHLYPTEPDMPPVKITRALHNLVRNWNQTDTVTVVRPVFCYLRQPVELIKNFRKRIIEIDNVTVIIFPIFKLPKVAYLYSRLLRFLDKYLAIAGIRPDVVVAHYEKSLHIGSQYARRAGLPLVAGLHITPDLLDDDPMDFTRRCGHILEQASAIACRSLYIRKKIEAWFPEYRNKCFVAFSGIEDRLIQPLELAIEKLAKWKSIDNMTGKKVSILSVSSLIEVKKIDTVIEAVALLPGHIDWHYDIVGDGEERPRLETLVDRLGVRDRIAFHGRLTREEAIGFMKRSHILVMVSILETFGLVYLEGMATGNIVIGGKDEGIDGIIVHGQNGFLSPPAQPEPLAALLTEIIGERSRSELEAVLTESYRTITRYTDENAARNYAKYVKSLADL